MTDDEKYAAIDAFSDEIAHRCAQWCAESNGMKESDVMDALAIVIGNWIALMHEHFFPQNRHHTLRRYQRLIGRAMDTAWKELMNRQHT